MIAEGLDAGDVAERSRLFRTRFGKALAVASVFISAAATLGALKATNPATAAFPALGIVIAIGAFVAIDRGRVRFGTNVLLAANSLLLTVSSLSEGTPELRYLSVQLYTLIVVMGSLFEGFRGGGALLALSAIGGALRPILVAEPAGELIIAMQTCGMVTGWLCGGYAERYFGGNERMLAERVKEMAVVVDDAQRIAGGDLAEGAATSQVMDRMLAGLRRLVERSLDSVTALSAATVQVSQMSRHQTRHATEQAAEVTRTKATLAGLDVGTATIADAARDVLVNAEATLEAHRVAKEHTDDLVAKEERVGEVLGMIKDVARRSEILALNASLEGTKAGEAGRGFSLVASHMRALAEKTSENLKHVREIVTDIRHATKATAEAIAEATRRAASTAERAQGIALTARAQAGATHEVLTAMEEIATLSQGFAETSEETLSAMSELTARSAELEDAVATFQL